MTQEEWLQSSDPTAMLHFLRGKASDRKLKLFILACCRASGHEAWQAGLETAEGWADGKATWQAMWQDYHAVISRRFVPQHPFIPNIIQRFLGIDTMQPQTQERIRSLNATPTYVVVGGAWDVLRQFTDPEMAPNVAAILRCLFGNPLRPIALAPSLLTDTVIKLAQGIYEERAFDRMPVLADALEEAGATDPDLLNHCRQPGVHARGCHVVDAILGKS
jgi:hypothetical protein